MELQFEGGEGSDGSNGDGELSGASGAAAHTAARLQQVASDLSAAADALARSATEAEADSVPNSNASV